MVNLDVNVAYGKSVTYAANDGTTAYTKLLTDGLADSITPVNTAECVSLSRTGAYFNLDLGQNYPVRSVTIYGKDDGKSLLQFKRRITFYNNLLPSFRKHYQFE